MRRQIIPAILKDRNYIADNRYEVVTPDGRVVTSGVVTDDVLAQLRAGKLMVRQKPGPKNALGLVKLMFPNEYYVYLHSTPSTELFARSQRAFSSGCTALIPYGSTTLSGMISYPSRSSIRLPSVPQKRMT